VTSFCHAGCSRIAASDYLVAIHVLFSGVMHADCSVSLTLPGAKPDYPAFNTRNTWFLLVAVRIRIWAVTAYSSGARVLNGAFGTCVIACAAAIVMVA
jgi:hypothetical protein